MNIIDFVIILVIIISIILGYRHGLIRSLFSILAIFGGFFIAGQVTRIFGIFGGHNYIKIFCFLFLFVIFYSIINYLGRFIRFLSGFVIKNFANRSGGVLFGLTRGIIVIGVVIVVLIAYKPKWQMMKGSAISSIIAQAMKGSVFALPQKLKLEYQEGLKKMNL